MTVDETDDVTVEALLNDAQDLLALRAAKAEDDDAEDVSLEDVKKMFGMP